MAACSSRNDTTMRRKDFRGDHVYMGAVASISCRMVCKFSGRKMSRSSKLVMRRVLVGGVGCVSGGMLDRSKLREDLDEVRRSWRGRCGSDGEPGVVVGDRVPAMTAVDRIVVLTRAWSKWCV